MTHESAVAIDALRIAHDAVRLWRILSTPPLSGIENMRYDAGLLQGVEQGAQPPTLRFFRFREPTVSYGRLQKLKDIASLVPSGWASVQRPTGGGVVLHHRDLCLSMCWSRGQAPLPAKPQEVYRWIHEVIRKTLGDRLRMVSCTEVYAENVPFAIRECFTNPVGYDLLDGTQKVVGGALYCRRHTFLYQGSIQADVNAETHQFLANAFECRFHG